MTDDELKSIITFGKFQNVDMRVAVVRSAPIAPGTNAPSRLVSLDLGPLGRRQSVAQFALVDEEDLVGKYVDRVHQLGAEDRSVNISPKRSCSVCRIRTARADQAQAIPLSVSDIATPGDRVF